MILFSSSFIPFSFASVESEAQEDIQAGCRDGFTLVYKSTYNQFICVPPDTAERWVELGMAEIISESEQVEREEVFKTTSQYVPAPPPPPPPERTTSIDDSTGCREGYALVFRFVHHDTFCTSHSTAASWERLGLAEIVSSGSKTTTDNEEEQIHEEIKDSVIEDQSKTVVEKPTQKPIPIHAEKISLPTYPNQPSIRPELEATNDFWSPPKVHQVNDRIWVAVGYDISNSIMIEGDNGIIIVDTLSTYESAKKVLAEFRKITDKPVKTIIYTHGHLDHVHGTKAFLEEATDDVVIVAHESLLDFYINENSVLGPIASTRTAYASGAFLPDDGPDRINLGVFPKFQHGTIAFVPPTHTFSSELSLDISGVKMELAHVAGESSDQIYVWLPDDEALLIGDNVYAIFPNIYTLRGAVYRDPMNYVNAYDKMIPLEPEYLVPSHVKPVSGKEQVMDILISTRDATQYIYDQTIRGMNNGYTVDELSNMIELPSWFEENPWLTQSRGQIPWHVKQIYYGNLGWYQGDPAFLLPISDEQRANKFVDGFGGIDKTIQQIRQAIDDDEYNWAAELATYVITTDPDNEEAKLLKAHALRVIGQRMLSADARHWALTSALELEGKITIDPNAVSQTSLEQLAELPIEKILRALPTKLDPEKTKDGEFILNVIYTDTDQEFTLHFRNGILAVNSGLSTLEDHSIILDTSTHKLLVRGDLGLDEAITSGQIGSIGDHNSLQYWINTIGP